uniref:Tyrosinase copper-binding domain-containing protein n=1 Tax=Cannabis sativa TaxID=3483 RepID=A0A803Q4R1_CANSA
MVFPKMFRDGPFDDSQREPTHFDEIVDLNYDEELGIVKGQERVNANLAFMYNQVVSAAKKPELFMGCPLYPGEDGFCDGPGTIELAPHNTIHTWVGLESNPNQENMGAFYSAGFDPCFYSNHANIDRIWDIWRDIHDMQMPINDTVWLDSHFYFYNENLQLIKMKVCDVLNTTKMGYIYEKTDLTWLDKRPKPFVSPQIAKHTLKIRENYYKETSRLYLLSNDIKGRSLENPMTIKVYRPKPYRIKDEMKEEEEVLTSRVFKNNPKFATNKASPIVNPNFMFEYESTFKYICSEYPVIEGVTFRMLTKHELNINLEDLEMSKGDSDEWKAYGAHAFPHSLFARLHSFFSIGY